MLSHPDTVKHAKGFDIPVMEQSESKLQYKSAWEWVFNREQS